MAFEFYIEVDRQSGDKGDERCDKPEYGRQTSHTLDINSRYVSLLDVAIDKRPSVRRCSRTHVYIDICVGLILV